MPPVAGQRDQEGIDRAAVRRRSDRVRGERGRRIDGAEIGFQEQTDHVDPARSDACSTPIEKSHASLRPQHDVVETQIEVQQILAVDFTLPALLHLGEAVEMVAFPRR